MTGGGSGPARTTGEGKNRVMGVGEEQWVTSFGIGDSKRNEAAKVKGRLRRSLHVRHYRAIDSRKEGDRT